MDMEEFCDNHCPMSRRIVQRDLTVETDCDCEFIEIGSDCPFDKVDFNKVKLGEFNKIEVHDSILLAFLDEARAKPEFASIKDTPLFLMRHLTNKLALLWRPTDGW